MESSSKIFELTVSRLHWLSDEVRETDLCAHGAVTVRIGGIVLASPDDDEWCVSAAALYLLRTLTSDHTTEHPVGEHLIPHCGHTMYRDDNVADVTIIGCYIGIDWEVRHHEGQVLLTAEGSTVTIPFTAWRDVVCAFSDDVAAFYQHSTPRVIPDDQIDAEGYATFCEEWERRRRAAGCG